MGLQESNKGGLLGDNVNKERMGVGSNNINNMNNGQSNMNSYTQQ
jgi:hypothetical protein